MAFEISLIISVVLTVPLNVNTTNFRYKWRKNKLSYVYYNLKYIET